MRHRLERDERAALVERRMDEERRRLVPRVQGRIVCAADQHGGAAKTRVADCGSRRGRNGPSPTTTQRHGLRQSSAVRGQRAERGGEDVEALVLLEPADAEQHAHRRGRCRPRARTRAASAGVASRSSARRSSALGMTRTRSSRHVEVLEHHRLERAIGGDDAIGGARAGEDRRRSGR